MEEFNKQHRETLTDDVYAKLRRVGIYDGSVNVAEREEGLTIQVSCTALQMPLGKIALRNLKEIVVWVCVSGKEAGVVR
jgi:hypothetical protein